MTGLFLLRIIISLQGDHYGTLTNQTKPDQSVPAAGRSGVSTEEGFFFCLYLLDAVCSLSATDLTLQRGATTSEECVRLAADGPSSLGVYIPVCLGLCR